MPRLPFYGRSWLVSETVDSLHGEDSRMIDLFSGTETMSLDENVAAGHLDRACGYTVAADSWDSHPNPIKHWKSGQASLDGRLVHHNMDWNGCVPSHVSHANAKPVVSPEQRYPCGSVPNRTNTSRANEMICFLLDGSLPVLVVAPATTDLGATGGRRVGS